MNRRTFSASLLAAPLAAQAAPRVKAAFLGLQHSHAFDKLRLVQAHARYTLAGAWEPDTAVRADYGKLPAFPWLGKDAILRDPSITAVFIQSEVKTHGPLALEAVRAGKHVHIEKPPSETLAEFREIVETARAKNLRLQTGYMWRFNPAVVRAIEAARNGWLGDIYHIHARMNTIVGADRRPEWNLFSGGQMYEQGAHLTDIIVRTLGKPARITSFLRHDGAFDDTLKDNTAAVFEYPRAFAILVSSVLQPNAGRHRALEIFGTKGNAVVRPIEPPSLEIDLTAAAGPYRQGHQKVDLPPYERYTGDIDELAAALLDNAPMSVTLDQELDVQETLLRASLMLP
jgi:predicted dehydrogenase